MRPGEIHLCDFGSPIGHEAGFRRPAVVMSPFELNRHGIVIVVPVTRARRGYSTHVELEGALPVVSYVQCELIRTVSTERLIRQVGAIDAVPLEAIKLILRRLLGMSAPAI